MRAIGPVPETVYSRSWADSARWMCTRIRYDRASIARSSSTATSRVYGACGEMPIGRPLSCSAVMSRSRPSACQLSSVSPSTSR